MARASIKRTTAVQTGNNTRLRTRSRQVLVVRWCEQQAEDAKAVADLRRGRSPAPGAHVREQIAAALVIGEDDLRHGRAAVRSSHAAGLRVPNELVHLE